MKELGKGWKSISDKQRVPYQKEATRLKEVYLKEMESYVPPEGFPAKKVDKDKPKKPLTNYILFCKEKRPQVLKENPDIKATQVLSKLGGMWGELSDKQKEPFNKKAVKAKIEYLKAMDAYNKKKGIKAEEKKVNSKKKAVIDDSEDDLSDSEE